MSTIPGTRVIFSPKGGASKELLRLIKAAKGNIVVAAYAFSSKYLGTALSAALKRGVKVRIILDGDIARKAYSIDEWLAGEGIEVRFIDVKGGSLHHKFMIIDGKILMTGSYNFTNESEFRNHEAAIFTNNKAVIQSFAAESHAAVAARAQMLRLQGVAAELCDGTFRPLPDAELARMLAAEGN